LASQLAELFKNGQANEERLQQISDLESKYPTIPADLVEKLKTYFENNEESLEI
jgi:hypothetical protein